MLLTVPWFMSILAGRVPLVDGEAIYSKKKRKKLGPSKRCWCCATGVEAMPVVKTNGIVMVLTLLSYLLVQIPSFFIGSHGHTTDNETLTHIEAHDIKYWALASFVVATGSFVAYLIYSAKNTGEADNENSEARLDMIGAK